MDKNSKMSLTDEIENVKSQLNLVNFSISVAAEGDKPSWESKKNELQARLAELEQQLSAESVSFSYDPMAGEQETKAAAEPEAVPFDFDIQPVGDQEFSFQGSGDTAASNASTSDLSDAEAEAMLNSILAAEEPQSAQGAQDSLNDAQTFAAEQSDAQILQDTDLPLQESELRAAAQDETITDTMAEAMLNTILEAEEPKPEKVETPPDDNITDAMADAMLRSILLAEEPPKETSPEFTAGDAELMLRRMLDEKQTAAPQPVIVHVPAFKDNMNNDELKQARAELEQSRLEIERLRIEAQNTKQRAIEELKLAKSEAEKLRKEAEQIRLNAETERAMYAAETELERGRRAEAENIRIENEKIEKARLAEKIARRKAEITVLRNGIQDVKDADSAFHLREKFFSVQLVLDEEERNSAEITYLLSKSMDDVNHAVEMAELKKRLAALTAKRKTSAATAKKKPVAKKKTVTAAKKKRPVAATQTRRAAPRRSGSPTRRPPSPRGSGARGYYR